VTRRAGARTLFAALAVALTGAAIAAIVAAAIGGGLVVLRVAVALLAVFLCGAAAASGVSLLGRGRLRLLGLAALVAVAGELPLLMVGVWKGELYEEGDAINALPTGLAWVTATLVIATLPLVAGAPRVLRWFLPAVALTALAAASLLTYLIYWRAGGEAHVRAVIALAIAALAGWLIAPTLERALGGLPEASA
jgi:hypothetical protein